MDSIAERLVRFKSGEYLEKLADFIHGGPLPDDVMDSEYGRILQRLTAEEVELSMVLPEEITSLVVHITGSKRHLLHPDMLDYLQRETFIGSMLMVAGVKIGLRARIRDLVDQTVARWREQATDPNEDRALEWVVSFLEEQLV